MEAKMKQVVINIETKDGIDIPTNISIEDNEDTFSFGCDGCGCEPDAVFMCYDGYATVNLCAKCYMSTPDEPDESDAIYSD